MIAIFVGNLINLGDALIALRQAAYLKEKGHKVIILPYEDVSHELRSEFLSLGINILSIRNNPVRAILTCFRSHIIFGGGHMIRNHVSLFGLLFCNSAFAASRLFGHRIFIAGVGATPISSHIKKLLFKTMLTLSNIVHVRDPNSEKILKTLAPACKAKIHLGGDMAYIGDPLQKRNTEGVCAISPAVDKSENRAIDLHEILDVLNKLKPEGLKRIILIPHDLRDDFDMQACQEIKSFLTERINTPIEIYKINSVTTGLIQAYESASWVITSRLHGLILSSILGRQVFYTDKSAAKLKYFADLFGYPSTKNFISNGSPTKNTAIDFSKTLATLSKTAEQSISGL